MAVTDNHSVVITGVRSSQMGQYMCTATNAVGQARSIGIISRKGEDYCIKNGVDCTWSEKNMFPTFHCKSSRNEFSNKVQFSPLPSISQ